MWHDHMDGFNVHGLYQYFQDGKNGNFSAGHKTKKEKNRRMKILERMKVDTKPVQN